MKNTRIYVQTVNCLYKSSNSKGNLNNMLAQKTVWLKIIYNNWIGTIKFKFKSQLII